MTRGTTEDVSVMEAVAAQRRELAALLGRLAPEAWDRPSLCAHWRVRDVVAHVTMPFRYSTRRFITEMFKAHGNFDRMADRCARRDGQASPDELLAGLRRNEQNPWKPPGGGLAAALTHDVIHGQDITVALDVKHLVPEERLRIVLATITTPKSLKHFGTDLTGIELRASDIDWSFGSGAPLSGSGQDLALVLCARKLPVGRLRGASSARFTASQCLVTGAGTGIRSAKDLMTRTGRVLPSRVPVPHDEERDRDQPGGQGHEDGGLDELERPEPVARLIGHERAVAEARQACECGAHLLTLLA